MKRPFRGRQGQKTVYEHPLETGGSPLSPMLPGTEGGLRPGRRHPLTLFIPWTGGWDVWERSGVITPSVEGASPCPVFIADVLLPG